MVRRFFTWLGSVAGGFSAAFLAFVTLFGAIGAVIARPFSAEATCWPHHSVLYLFETFCENKAADTAWWGTVELSRFAVAMPALSLHFYETLKTANTSLLIEGFVWTVTVLTLIVVWAGFRHWRVRFPVVAWVLLAMFVGLAVMAAAPAELGTRVAAPCKSARETNYFPVGSFRGYPSHLDADALMRGWFSYQLSAMQEPSLLCDASEDTETYRFLWLRTFHEPVAVRIYRRGDRYGLEAVVMDGQGGYEPGQISKRVTKELSLAQWRRAVAALEEVQFWRMRTTTSDLIGIDGAKWIVEGRRGGRYHVAVRRAGFGLVPVGEVFLDLAGLRAIEPVY